MKKKKIKKNYSSKAIIVGSDGQDGTILAKKLKKLKYKIYKVSKKNFNIKNSSAVRGIVKKIRPKEIYYLAAHHHSSEDKNLNNNKIISETMKININAVIFFLDAIARYSPKTRFFYASSSLVFAPSKKKQNENTKLEPRGYYALSKAAGMIACRHFRRFKNVFASVGILYNHESQFRKKNFLTKKIISTAAKISIYKKKYLEIGNLNSQVDWGYADDYVDAMIRILSLKKPNDFIIASGKAHTVRQFVKKTFDYFGLDYKKHVKSNSKILFRNYNNNKRIGDASRLKKLTGWKPKVDFNNMVKKLAEAEKNIL